MNIRKHDTLPAHLSNAHQWISAAGEWDEASKNPEEYSRAAFLNAVENEQFYILEEDLLDVIIWHKRNNY